MQSHCSAGCRRVQLDKLVGSEGFVNGDGLLAAAISDRVSSEVCINVILADIS